MSQIPEVGQRWHLACDENTLVGCTITHVDWSSRKVTYTRDDEPGRERWCALMMIGVLLFPGEPPSKT